MRKVLDLEFRFSMRKETRDDLAGLDGASGLAMTTFRRPPDPFKCENSELVMSSARSRRAWHRE